MPGYRFCRSDDLPALVRAYHECLAPHVPGAPRITPEILKKRGRMIDFWSSSCMLAFDDDLAIGVLLAAKRATETLVLGIGIRDGHRHQGHGRHLIESLASKLAILGPPLLLAEVDADDSATRRFFERCGWREAGTSTDLELARPAGGTHDPARSLTARLTFEELVEASGGSFPIGSADSWFRSAETLRHRAPELECVAVVSDRVEAWALARPLDDLAGAAGARALEVLGIGVPGRQEALSLVVDALVERSGGSVRVPKLAATEIEPALLEALGFRAVRRWLRYALQVGVG